MRLVAAVAVWLSVCLPVSAQSRPAETPAGTPPTVAPPPASQPAKPPWPQGVRPLSLSAPTVTDQWFGLGPYMADAGIKVDYFWNSHFMSGLGGGLETGGPKHSSTYDLFITLDLEKMGLLKGADMLVQARQQWGRSINRWMGTAQDVNDDADGGHGIYVDQLWFRQGFANQKIQLQVGYLDYQTIVDRNAFANSEDKQFMNTMLDNNPVIPTASATGLGAALYLKPTEWYQLILGAADAQRLPLYKPGFSTTFHDQAWFLGYLENDFILKIPSSKGPLVGNYRVGAVYDPIPRNVYVRRNQRPETEGSDVGLYLSVDQMVWKENAKDAQGLGVFGRYGYRHDETPHDAGFFNQFWSTGLSYTGLVPTRDKDTLGFAVAQLISSEEYEAKVNREADCETAYELYYAIQLTPWLVLTPDIQYIDNPGGRNDDGVAHAIAGGFRVRVTF